MSASIPPDGETPLVASNDLSVTKSLFDDFASPDDNSAGAMALESALRSESLSDLSNLISVESNFTRDLHFIYKNIRFSIDIEICMLIRFVNGMRWETMLLISDHKFVAKDTWDRVDKKRYLDLETMLDMQQELSSISASEEIGDRSLLEYLLCHEASHYERFRHEKGGVLFLSSSGKNYSALDKTYLNHVACIMSFCVEKDISNYFLSNVYTNLKTVANKLREEPNPNMTGLLPAMYSDISTGLHNKLGFLRLLQHLIESGQEKIHVIVLSIDKFSYFCNLFDERIKEQFLRKTIDRIKKIIRNNFTLSYVGSSDLAFTIVNSDKNIVDDALTKIINLFEEDLQVDDIKLRFDICAGYSCYPECSTSADTLLKMANIALFQASKKSTTKLVSYQHGMNEAIKGNIELARSIRQAIVNDEFDMHFQPIVSADHTNQPIHHFESLVRWIHPDKGIISPTVFIEIAEASGDIIPLGYLIVERVCKHLSHPAIPSTVTVSINVSPVQIREANLVEKIVEITNKYDINVSRITLEITETAAMLDSTLSKQRFTEFRQAGFKLSVDDFGTGYSSLSYLLNFSFDVLKIDKSFIDNSIQNGGYSIIASTIISLAHKLSMSVVCEGIETDEQLSMVKGWGADTVQGYLISKPKPLKDFFG